MAHLTPGHKNEFGPAILLWHNKVAAAAAAGRDLFDLDSDLGILGSWYVIYIRGKKGWPNHDHKRCHQVELSTLATRLMGSMRCDAMRCESMESRNINFYCLPGDMPLSIFFSLFTFASWHNL